MLRLPTSIAALVLAPLTPIAAPAHLAGVGHERIVVAPGAPAETNPRVRVLGSSPVDGAVLYLPISSALYSGSFANCVVGTGLTCTFDTRLTPGQTYRLSEPLPLRPPRNAAAGSRSANAGRWLAKGETSGLAELNRGEPGTGRPVVLVPDQASSAPSAARAPSATWAPSVSSASSAEAHPGRADLTVTVHGRVRPDLAAVGATLTAAIGETLTITAGARNLGPGTLLPPLFPNNRPLVKITLPSGLKTMRTDEHCHPSRDHRTYFCRPAAATIRPGGTALFTFTVEVTARPSGGAVAVNSWTGPIEAGRNPANDHARLIVDRPGGATSTGGTASMAPRRRHRVGAPR